MARMTSAQQIEQLTRIARELGREIATGKEAREIYKIGVHYNSVEETLEQERHGCRTASRAHARFPTGTRHD